MGRAEHKPQRVVGGTLVQWCNNYGFLLPVTYLAVCVWASCVDQWSIYWLAEEGLESGLRTILQEEQSVVVSLYRIQILCRRHPCWSYPAGLTIADPPG